MASKLPTVAIIGQANVGKSSLFNRMVRAQQAIVAREAGTTRDNVIGKVGYRDHEFWLVDTAGLKNPEDEFEASIQEQIEEAAEAADIILVTVDSSLYPSDDDRMVAKKALKTKKPVILVTNKADLKTALPDNEFRRLGIKTIIRTSAEHNSGITDVLNTIVSEIPARTEQEDDDILRIALIGRPNVGKSHLFNTLAGKQQAVVANIAGTTRDVNRVHVRYHGRTVELLDTAGIRRQGKQEVGIEKFSVLRTLQAIEEADICLLLMDVNELNTQLDQRLAGIIDEAGKGMIIVISKWDSLEERDETVSDDIARRVSYNFKFTPWAPLVFTSSVTGQNVTKLFDLATEIETRRNQETKTRILNDLLQRAVQSHPPAGLKNTHPKLRYIVQTDVTPPWFVIYGSNLKFIHWSYKRYLERLLRETYDYTGTPIKLSFRDEKQIKTNKERVAQGKAPVTKAYKQAKESAE
ncbi:small GTP-binding protein [Candidatus Saccharibacteria bacterium RAAC3_TM7_1]|nr:small GTP-binding protein [Candidatus Saccharibacteria bacterium RAAC3_TM7_1]HCZ28361.1 ribosome biogenesis GTPase Der [Candidatus Saccharibacteria bacterium]